MTPDSNGADGNGADSSPQQQQGPMSLREAAESAWNELESQDDDSNDQPLEQQEPSQDGGRARDQYGRFLPQGEQTTVPAPAEPPATQQPQQVPQPATSIEAPQHWPAQDRTIFNQMPQEAKDVFLRRYQEMERDYTQKSQANATAIEFTQSLAPIFTHPDVQRSLVDYQTGQPVHPAEAIRQWTEMHLRATNPDPNVRAGFARDLMQRLQLDPAAVFGLSPLGNTKLTPEQLQDPTVRFLADFVGKATNDVTALRGELNTIRAQTAEQQKAENLRYARQGIDAFADAVDPQGRKMYPHFDAVLPELIELYAANPNRDLREAYDKAVWMSATVRPQLQQAQSEQVRRQQDNQRAAAAARGNIRGRTAPVAKGGSANQQQGGLRAAMEAAADEIGFEG